MLSSSFDPSVLLHFIDLVFLSLEHATSELVQFCCTRVLNGRSGHLFSLDPFFYLDLDIWSIMHNYSSYFH